MSELNKILEANAKSIQKSVTDGVTAGAFDADLLRQLSELEAQGQKRQPVLVLISKAIDELVKTPPPKEDDEDDDSKEESFGPEKKAGKEARGEIPDWQKPDYSGPLTCEKAEWRNKNIKTK